MSTSDELNLAQDRLTSVFVSAARQLKIYIGNIAGFFCTFDRSSVLN